VRLRLPGRFERRGSVVLDVAHNVEAARVLAHNLRTLARGGFSVVMGMLSDKPVEGFAAELAPLAAKFYAAGLPPPRGLPAGQLAARLAGTGRPVATFADVGEAFSAAQAESAPGELVVACGSFLTVAAVAERLHG
jgi:dihydrofolate synthase/folylpolyglutamate synthase